MSASSSSLFAFLFASDERVVVARVERWSRNKTTKQNKKMNQAHTEATNRVRERETIRKLKLIVRESRVHKIHSSRSQVIGLPSLFGTVGALQLSL